MPFSSPFSNPQKDIIKSINKPNSITCYKPKDTPESKPSNKIEPPKRESKKETRNKIERPKITWDPEPRNKITTPKHSIKYPPKNDIRIKKVQPKSDTLDLIQNLVKELSNVAPSRLKRESGLSKGRLSYTWISKNIFQKSENYLTRVQQRIINPNDDDYNPRFKFSLEVLNIVKNRLKNFTQEWRKDNQNCSELINVYISNNEELKRTSHQQWDTTNPKINPNFFSNITKKGAYWLGFLCADGYLIQRKQIGITLSRKDKDQLLRYCCDIGLNPKSKIRDFERELNGKIYELSRVVFGCKPIVNDLISLRFKNVPEFVKNSPYPSNNSNALSWLCGLYDGDGQEGKTALYSTKKSLLEQIKVCFNVPNKVCHAKNPRIRLDHLGKIRLNRDGEPLKTKSLYVLRLGPSLFNRMMNTIEETIQRKRHIFNERIDATIKLKTIFNNKRDLLQDLVDHFPRAKIISILNNNFRISKTALYNVINEWNIKIPPTGYWNSQEGKNNRKSREWFFDKIGFKV